MSVLYSEKGLPLIVAMFMSEDKHTQILACLLSAVAITSQVVDDMRVGEIMAKIEQCWPLTEQCD